MRLTAHRLERLKRSLELALNQEWPRLSAATNHLAVLHPTPIAIRPAQASTLPVVATVATDGVSTPTLRRHQNVAPTEHEKSVS